MTEYQPDVMIIILHGNGGGADVLVTSRTKWIYHEQQSHTLSTSISNEQAVVGSIRQFILRAPEIYCAVDMLGRSAKWIDV